MAAHAAAAGAAATGVVGFGAFKYNRENFLFDQGQRYARYTSGYTFAIEQAEMYREDIRDLTELTTSKQDFFFFAGVIFFVIILQLIMAGRLGVHGPAPPGWLLGLYWINTGCSLMFLCLSTWLSSHASARATAGMTHLLTHHVRLPIPSPQQLDKARKFATQFENERVGDMVRVPFLMPNNKEKPVASDTEAKGGKKAKPRRMPKWYTDEQAELHNGTSGFAPGVPEHFERYRHLQQEWWAHDIYSRIGFLYTFQCWLHGASLYTQCHAFAELRALWPAWSCTFIFVCCHYCLLKIDIVSAPNGRMHNFPIENIAPLMPIFTVLGMSLDFSALAPTAGWRALIYIIAWCAYIIQILWAFRLYDVAEPAAHAEMPEVPGQPWWPGEFPVPASFQHALYLVTPPKALEPGMTCLQQEMKATKSGKAVPQEAHREVPPLFAWKIFRGGIFTFIAVTIFVTCGRVIEQINGERWFMKQEGRVMRWPSHMQPWMSPWSRQDAERGEWCHTGGCDRRLDDFENDMMGQPKSVAALAARLSGILGTVSDALEPAGPAALLAQPAGALEPVKLGWTTPLDASLLACGKRGNLAAFAQHDGTGASLPLSGAGAAVSPFSLAGVESLGPFVGTHWDDNGLMLASATGDLAQCDEGPQGSLWRCRRLPHRLPTGGYAIEKAAVARTAQGQLRAAVVAAGEPELALFESDGEEWLPAGGVQLPPHLHDGALRSISFTSEVESIILSGADGSVLKWPLGAHRPSMVAAPQPGGAMPFGRMWQAACELEGGRYVHLARGRVEDVFPDVFITATNTRM